MSDLNVIQAISAANSTAPFDPGLDTFVGSILLFVLVVATLVAAGNALHTTMRIHLLQEINRYGFRLERRHHAWDKV